MMFKNKNNFNKSPRKRLNFSALNLSAKYYFLLLVFLSAFIFTFVIPVTAQIIQKPSLIIVQTDARNLLDSGINLYEQDKFNDSISKWLEAEKEFRSKGDRPNQAITLSYLALAYQNLGQWEKAETAINNALALVDNSSGLILGKILTTQGSLQLAKGNTEQALETWKKAENIYKNNQDQIGVLGSRINQAQALQKLGLFPLAKDLLEQNQKEIEQQSDIKLKITNLRNLAIAWENISDFNIAEKLLLASLQLSENANLELESSITALDLGNNYHLLQKNDQALKYYQIAEKTSDILLKTQAQLNQLTLLIKGGNNQEAKNLVTKIRKNIGNITLNRAGIYAQVNLAQTLMKMTDSGVSNQEIGLILGRNIQQSEILKDIRSQSYSMGTLGKLYEQNQQWKEAEKLTSQALSLAQSINANDIMYQWQWQLGRIFKAQGDRKKAIASETAAVNTLQLLRTDLIAVNPAIQFSFRESVEPVYRELVTLLLDQPENTGLKNHEKSPDSPSQSNLKQALKVIEGLQLAELENFFREACLKSQAKQIDQIDQKAAVIYPIILSDRIAVISAFPNQQLQVSQIFLPKTEIEDKLELLLQSLNPAFPNGKRLKISQEVYKWIISPLEKDLQAAETHTLVFVLDGVLRNLPMSALYDGKQYLIEKYNVALTPGLELLGSKSLNQNTLKAIIGGLSEQRGGFVALPGVETEIKQISSQIKGQQLLNKEFTKANLQRQIQSTASPVIHLATHGQFSSEAVSTFILTWDEQVKVKDFQELLRGREQKQPTPVELLVLSACETAQGDKQAALGLAGVAIRSGARSTIATLWSVKDESTALLMTNFYKELSQYQGKINKAEVLRKAQISLLKSEQFAHPFYWAPFVLVGNWL
jgi:CHAT domain-containing protein